jgi:uncharacterized protein (TIGR02001 family)
MTMALLLTAPALRAQGWGGAVGVTSDYVYRGLTQSDNQPAGQADLHYYSSAGWLAGLWASSVRRSPFDSTTAEFDPYLGYNWPLQEPWSLRLLAVHHDYPWNNPGRHYNYDEVSATLGLADRAFFTAAYAPDLSIDGPYRSATGRSALSYDLALHQPLLRALSANAGVGYYDLRWAVDSGYVYWNAGLAYDFGRLQLDLSYIGTSQAARSLFYEDVAVNRLVATLLWHF